MLKKKVLIIHYNMELGGVETSLLGLLDQFDYDKFDVDLFLLSHEGVLLSLVNEKVNILPEIKEYKALSETIVDNFKQKEFGIAIARTFSKIVSKITKSNLRFSHNYKQYFHKLSLPFLPKIDGNYDLAISFNDPHFIIGKKVNATVKMSWFHTDASRLDFCDNIEKEMWSLSDYVVNVSEECKNAFDKKHSYLSNQSIVIENILSKGFIDNQADLIDVSNEMDISTVKLLSVGRFSEAKNFDEVPQIASIIKSKGIDFKWYIIGYGSEEDLIRSKISEFGMEDTVVILGKKDNPYPYIKACDIYLQPSRYEGKCVAVREAQILNKPVIITNYATANSQLKDGYDGVIVPMDNEGCAQGIVDVIKNKELQRKLIENTKTVDYTNSSELQKIYDLIK